MNDECKHLWTSIEQFCIDDGDPDFLFSHRLARENGWSIDFSDRVTREYKKFVFLCAVSGHSCTPSEHVDQAWHLHLTFTKSYWDRLCGDVLPSPLHHNPTRGGDSERGKFNDWYEKTKESYRTFFKSEPPVDIWPEPARRFGHDLDWERVNRHEYLLVPKRAVLWGIGAPLFLLAVFLLAGMSAGGSDPGSDVTHFIVVGIASVCIGIATASVVSKFSRRNMLGRVRSFLGIFPIATGVSASAMLLPFIDPEHIPALLFSLLVVVVVGGCIGWWTPSTGSSGSGGCGGCGGCAGCGGCGG